MKKYNCFLLNIANELNIKKGNTEDVLMWKSRIIYSILGRMSLASLWDREDCVSMDHFKERAAEIKKAYTTLYPEINSVFDIGIEELSNEIYDIYCCTGLFYHKQYNIAPVPEKISFGNKFSFIRGSNLCKNVYMSGLGTYIKSPVSEEKNLYAFEDIFRLQKSDITDFLECMISRAHWVEMKNEYKKEYLRVMPPFNYGYWSGEPERNGSISILKLSIMDKKEYHFYYYDRDRLYFSALPNFLTENGEYRRIAVGILKRRGTLPKTYYTYDGDIVRIRQNYLFPPSELNFLKLYSWPCSFFQSKKNDFNMIMQKDIFEMIKTYFENIGYLFREV